MRFQTEICADIISEEFWLGEYVSLYASYLRERTNDEIIEKEFGFASYRFLNDKQVYIIDLYVRPAHRKEGLAAQMADDIAAFAKAKGCTEMLGTVVPSTKHATSSLKVLLAYGMILQSASNDLIIFKKDI